MYYRGAAAAIVVYDITNPDSFAGAKSWVKELQRRGDQNVVIALVSASLLDIMLPLDAVRRNSSNFCLSLLIDSCPLAL